MRIYKFTESDICHLHKLPKMKEYVVLVFILRNDETPNSCILFILRND
jgi:hypothetical protein